MQGISDEEEIAIVFSPGGKYTKADIKANGKVLPSVKYKGVLVSNEVKSKPGDTTCVHSGQKFHVSVVSWIIAGKKYEFCCPECIDEVILIAKNTPEKLKPPEFYKHK
ncbi:MAG: hypothetical protein EXS11_08055 [Gemmataceae bacterium]|nr:hypothetical protein [Gemmataceae bacterium]